MIRGRDINTDLSHCKSAIDMQIFTQTRIMMSRVITKHLCNYRNSFYKYNIDHCIFEEFSFQNINFLEISMPLVFLGVCYYGYYCIFPM